jgi:hypothetical protein
VGIGVWLWWPGASKAPTPKDQGRVVQKDKVQEPAKTAPEKTVPPPAPAAAAPRAVGGEGVVYTWQGWLYYLPAVGQPPRKLVQGRGPSLSPDGQRVAYMMDQGAAILDLATGQHTVISTEWGLGAPLVWSPRGDLLAYVIGSDRGGPRRQLYVMRPDGTGRREIVSVNNLYAPYWAADGNSLFCHDLSTLYQVGLKGEILSRTPLDAIGGDPNAFTSTDRFAPSPTDPNLAAFTQSVPGSPLFQQVFQEPGTALFTYNFQQKKFQRLTPMNLMAFKPVWSRDGRYIYFCGFYDWSHRDRDRFRLYRVRPDGSALTATDIRLDNVDWAW